MNTRIEIPLEKFTVRLSQPETTLWYDLRHNRTIWFVVVFLFLLFMCTALCDLIVAYPPDEQGDLITSRYLAPSLEHPFGTDKFARDIFSRILYGGRISLSIGLVVVLMSSTIGVIYGAISGYFGRWMDTILMRFLDFLLAFPLIILTIAVIAIFRPQFWFLILILGLTGWMETARLIRAEVLSVKERDFVLALKGFGFHPLRILFKHIIPNCMTPVFVAAPMKIGEVILLESALSFIGVGVQPPAASWGSIINDGKDVLLESWWISTIPGILIVLTVLCFNLIGEELRKKMNPSE